MKVIDVETKELDTLSRRTDMHRWQQRALEAEKMLRRERRERRKEQADLISFISVFALLLIMMVCLIAAPWWTAIAPLVMVYAVVKMAGW